ncbi:MAG: hypothetical protein Q8L79_16505 [Methylobacter sp.]|uniref:hypothetical protein n=1 Tax=Methylobacter sp. TaxID=2051955 RepID=UPI002730D0C0|nr:hypothetical protein [Methylobacter sp.]MDP1666712.1 hypothetical protein [Methylobacter sp.]
MSSFALITEGITDQITLETILYEHYDSDLEITSIQPIRDATDESRQQDSGGWEKVFEYCTLPDFQDSFLFNEYVVIQIDTDCAEHVNFGVAITDNGKDRPQIDIINDVINLLISKIGEDVYSEYKERILFAISVHSLECWYLPLFETLRAKQSRSKNCAGHLCIAVAKRNIFYKKEYEVYKNLAKAFKTKNAINQCIKLNESFGIFIRSLPKF